MLTYFLWLSFSSACSFQDAVFNQERWRWLTVSECWMSGILSTFYVNLNWVHFSASLSHFRFGLVPFLSDTEIKNSNTSQTHLSPVSVSHLKVLKAQIKLLVRCKLKISQTHWCFIDLFEVPLQWLNNKMNTSNNLWICSNSVYHHSVPSIMMLEIPNVHNPTLT